jgi:hypothetical protein
MIDTNVFMIEIDESMIEMKKSMVGWLSDLIDQWLGSVIGWIDW